MRQYNITDPIGSIQAADGDGGEATAFWPVKEFATQYMVTDDTSYITVACAPQFGEVSLAIYNASSTELETATCTPSGENPGQAYFGGDSGTNYNANYRVVSTDSPPKPFYAYWENQTEDDEQNFLAAPQSRQMTYPEPTYAFGAQETSSVPAFSQENFIFYANTNALTPTDIWPVGAEDLSENAVIGSTEAVDQGDELRLRMTMLVNNATTTALEDAFTLQFASTTIGATCDVGTLNWTNLGDTGDGSTAWRGIDNAAVADATTITSTTTSVGSVFGTYEEENNTAFLPGSYGPGEYIEFDWALDANNVETNTSYCFRMVGVGGTAIIAPGFYPQVNTNAAPDVPSLLTPFDNAKVSDLTPSLTFTANDAAGDDLDYQVQIDDNFDFLITGC